MFNIHTKCEAKHNGIWEWAMYGLSGWGIYELVRPKLVASLRQIMLGQLTVI